MLDLHTLVMRHDKAIKDLREQGGGGTSGYIDFMSVHVDNVSVSASGSSGIIDVDGTIPDGYEVIGVLAVYLANASSSGTNVTSCAINRFNPTSTGAQVRVRNVSSSAAKIAITCRLLLRRIDT